jgi:NADH:ubiquinone oxidoreductase subunit E
MVVSVCVGSSCHLKGAYEVITVLQAMIERAGRQSEIILKGEFCLGNCSDGVTVVIDGEVVYGVSPDEVEDFFESEILSRLKEAHGAHACHYNNRGKV